MQQALLLMAGYRLTEGQKGSFAPAILALVSLAAILIVLSLYDTNIKNIQTEEDAFGITIAVIAVAGLVLALIWSGWRAMRIEQTLQGVMLETAKTTSLVFIILLGAAMLTAAFRAFGGEELVRHFLETLPGGFWSQFVIVMAVIFVLGFFLDFIEIAVVVVPIVAPILLADPSANITAVWLGVMIGLNIQTSFLTPPFGFALFYLRGVAPAIVRTVDMYKGVVPFIGLQLLALVIVGWFPPLVNYLPNSVSLTAATAPPPINPRLQQCIEEMNFAIYDAEGDRLRSAIDAAAALDLSLLPDDLRGDFEEGIDKARSIFDQVANIRDTASDVAQASAEYAPLHAQVSDIQRILRQHESELEELGRERSMLQRNPEAAETRIAGLEQRMAELETESEALSAQIPPSFEERHKKFLTLTKAENQARQTYRRTTDDAYGALAETRLLISQAEAVDALAEPISSLAPIIEAATTSAGGEAAMEAIKTVEAQISEVDGASAIKSPLSKARRALRGDQPDTTEALAQLEESIEAQAQEASWRSNADASLATGLETYDLAIRETIGLRQQPRLTDDQASQIATCLSSHRDISLNF